MRAVVLAAGRGSRLGTLTDDVPKPLLPLGSSSILEQNLGTLAAHGVREVAINLHYQGGVIRERIGDGSRFQLEVVYSEEGELLGTAGGVQRAQGLLPPTWPLLVVYGDNLLKVDIAKMAAFHAASRAAGTIALHWINDIRASGAVNLDPQDRVTAFAEKAPQPRPVAGWVNAGLYLLEETAVDAIPAGAASDFGFDIFPKLLSDEVPLYGYRLGPSEAIYPIDTPKLYREALDAVEARRFRRCPP